MAQDGVLYDGWGAEGLKSLNASNSLLDHADDVGVNRYDLTRIVAQQAKDIAYAHCTEDDMLNPMLAGNQARTPRSRVPHVMRAIKELKLEIDESYALAADTSTPKAKPKAKASAKAAREGAAQASRGAAGPQRLARRRRRPGEPAEAQPGAAGRGGRGAGRREAGHRGGGGGGNGARGGHVRRRLRPAARRPERGGHGRGLRRHRARRCGHRRSLRLRKRRQRRRQPRVLRDAPGRLRLDPGVCGGVRAPASQHSETCTFAQYCSSLAGVRLMKCGVVGYSTQRPVRSRSTVARWQVCG